MRMSADGSEASTGTPTPETPTSSLLMGEMSVVARGTLLRGTSLATGLLLALPASALLVRALGVHDYGALSFAASVVGMASLAADLGLGLGIARMTSHEENQSGPWARLGAMTGLVVGSLATLVVLWLATYSHGTVRSALLFMAPIALLSGMRSILGAPLVAARRMVLLEGTQAAQNVLYYGGAILLVLLAAASVARVATVWTVATLIGVLAIVPAWLRAAPRSRVAGSGNLRTLLAFSIPLLMAGVSALVLQRSDVILLGLIRGQAAVGVYSPVLRLADVTNVALIAMASYYLPVATGLVRHKSFPELQAIFAVVTKWAIVLAAPLLVTLIVQPVPLLETLFGAPFAHAGQLAVVLGFGYAINVIAGLNGLTLVALGKSRQIGAQCPPHSEVRCPGSRARNEPRVRRTQPRQLHSHLSSRARAPVQ
jgi:O-antigen/teichoic acid export membrane protein